MRRYDVGFPVPLGELPTPYHNFSFDTSTHPTEHTFVEAYLARACVRSFRSARADYTAGTVAVVFGVRATPSRKAATGNDVIRQ